MHLIAKFMHKVYESLMDMITPMVTVSSMLLNCFSIAQVKRDGSLGAN